MDLTSSVNGPSDFDCATLSRFYMITVYDENNSAVSPATSVPAKPTTATPASPVCSMEGDLIVERAKRYRAERSALPFEAYKTAGSLVRFQYADAATIESDGGVWVAAPAG